MIYLLIHVYNILQEKKNFKGWTSYIYKIELDVSLPLFFLTCIQINNNLGIQGLTSGCWHLNPSSIT